MGKQLGKQDLDGFSFQADIFIRILGRFRNVNSSILLSVVSQDNVKAAWLTLELCGSFCMSLYQKHLFSPISQPFALPKS